MDILEITKSFPKEETYSLTNQIRRSSRSVCANLSEAYIKRRYIKNWISKPTDSDGGPEVSGLKLRFGWILPKHAIILLKKLITNQLTERSEEVGRLINYMINNPGKFGVKEV